MLQSPHIERNYQVQSLSVDGQERFTFETAVSTIIYIYISYIIHSYSRPVYIIYLHRITLSYG